VGRLNDKKSGEAGPLHETIQAADGLLARLNALMVEDVESFNAVVASWNLPDEDPSKNARKQEATLWATRIPLETMAKAIEVMRLAKVGLEGSKKSCLSDAGVAAFMAHAALEGARLNVLTNLPNIADERKRAECRSEAERLHNEAEALREEIDKAVEARCG
ncbi:MAG TPA: cyclodeaminase/cyclohydrolase family protein, partial [Phycisphaerae bacterium]|nr:cyclodeaminase/cyclohydrolase family protein [Phycisphaerae bacterium]